MAQDLRRLALAALISAVGGTAAGAQTGLSQGFDSEGREIFGETFDEVETAPLDAPLAEPQLEDAALQDLPPPEGFDEPPAQMIDAPKARLRGLDTLTNTVHDFEIGVGETLAFKRLIVTLEACRFPEGDLAAEAYAFLRIRDNREAEDRFSGWMLASSPALSALDHPRYDVWVLSCNTD